MKVVVIGAGVVGSAFAWHLAKEGTEVTVLEQGSISSGASSKSFGWLNSHYPELPEYHALRMASLAEHRNLDAGAIAQWHGSLWWEQGDETIEQHQSTLLASGQEAELLDHTRIQAIVPGITCPQGQAILSPAEGAADPGELANYFLDRARQHNTRVVCGIKVMGIEGTLSDGYRVKTASGVFRADRVVIAAGVATSVLCDQMGVTLPQQYRQGLIVRTRPVDVKIDPILLTPTAHFRQAPAGGLLIGEDFGGGNLQGLPEDIATRLCDAVRGYLPEIGSLDIEEITVGIRPEPRDGLPVLGYPQYWQGIYLACMHSGATLAPLVGKLGAREILEDIRLGELDSFRVERFIQSGMEHFTNYQSSPYL